MLTTINLSGIEFIIFRDDLNNPMVSGNKLHKLTPNIDIAKESGCSRILSFGGPYSNHLHALAWACNEIGLQSIGVVRGELQAVLTPTLTDCESWGMRLIPLSRKLYREYQERLTPLKNSCLAGELNISEILQDETLDRKTLVLSEGGSNKIAIKSLAKVYGDVFKKAECQNLTHAVCATGTGATVAGLYQATPKGIDVIGLQAVAEQDATIKRIDYWLGCSHRERLTIQECHLGRFGKIPPALITFMDNFEAQYGIPLDPIYTGKAMLRLFEMVESGYFKKTDRVLFIHTGGLQGKRRCY